MKLRDYVLIIGSLSLILFIICLGLLLSDKFSIKTCGCPNVIEQNFVYIFTILSAIFIAALVYYLTSLKIENQKQTIGKNISLVLNFLDDNEKTVLDAIIKNKGTIPQSELAKKFGKLKAHRTIKKLKEQKIISVTEGKTNMIELKEDLKKELVKQ